jgi:hypothetical protein
MPTHIEDVTLIPIILNTIFNHIYNNHLNNIILRGDFNRDIALIGKQHGTTKTNPTQQDLNGDSSWIHSTYSIFPQIQITHTKAEITTHQLAL